MINDSRQDQLKSYFHRFRGMDMRIQKNRQMLIDSLINRTYLYDDRLVISYSHKDGEETITLEDVETALAEAGFGSDLVSFAVPTVLVTAGFIRITVSSSQRF